VLSSAIAGVISPTIYEAPFCFCCINTTIDAIAGVVFTCNLRSSLTSHPNNEQEN